MSTFLRNIQANLQNTRRYFASIRPLIRLVWRASPLFFLTALGLTMLSGLLPLVSILITSMLIQLLTQAMPTAHNSSAFTGRLILLLALLAGAFL